MDLDIHQVIFGPVVSDKAYKLNAALKQLVFKVHAKANKPLIIQAFEKLFDVKVKAVRVIVRKGKRKFLKKRKRFTDALTKKAIVTLKEGYALDYMNIAASDPGKKQKLHAKHGVFADKKMEDV